MKKIMLTLSAMMIAGLIFAQTGTMISAKKAPVRPVVKMAPKTVKKTKESVNAAKIAMKPANTAKRKISKRQ